MKIEVQGGPGKARRRIGGFALFAALIAATGAGHLWLRASTWGLALNNDGVMYLAVAESLAAGAGLVDLEGDPLLLYAPFFPMLLALLSLFGIEALTAGSIVNIAAFGLIILASGLYLGRRVESRLVALGAAVVIMTSLSLSHWFSSFLSEPLFILLTLLALIALDAFLRRRQAANGGAAFLALSILCVGIAAVTRWAGVALIFAAPLIIAARCKPWRAGLKLALLYGFFASVPLAIALVRNWAVSATLTGDRHFASGQFLSDSLQQTAQELGRWLMPITAGPDYLPLPAGWPALGAEWSLYALAAAGVLAGLGAALVWSRLFGSQAAASPARDSGFVFGIFALVYIATLIIVIPLTVDEPIGSRYLAPCVAPVLFLGAFLLDALLRGARREQGLAAVSRRVAAALILIVCLVNVGFNVKRNVALTAVALDTGHFEKIYPGMRWATYNTAHWAQLEIIRYLKAQPLTGLVYANNRALLYYSGARVPIIRVRYPAEQVHDCQGYLQWAVAQARREARSPEATWIVWINRQARHQNWCKLPEEQLPPQLEAVASFASGAVFRLQPR